MPIVRQKAEKQWFPYFETTRYYLRGNRLFFGGSMKHWVFSLSILIGLGLIVASTALTPAWGNPRFQDNTSAPSVFAEAINPDANIRAEPTIDGERIGAIQPGTPYPIRGQRFEWWLIEFPSSVNGFAWVHQSVVTITGDVSTIPIVDPASLPSSQSPTHTATTNNILTHTATSVPPSEETPSPNEIAPTSTPTEALFTFTPIAATPTPLNFSELENNVLSDPDAEIERRLSILEQVYVQQPILLTYQGQLILLDPSEVGFQINQNEMRARLQDSISEAFVITTTPIVADFSPDLIQVYLEDIAARYDVPASAPTFSLEQLTFQAGEAGIGLDVGRAEGVIVAALFSPNPEGRLVTLPLLPITKTEDGLPRLEDAILSYLSRQGVVYSGVNSVISVYVQDLETGQAMGIQENILHSATSTAKIGVIANYFRYIYQDPNDEMKMRLLAAVVCSSNIDANILMNVTGNGDAAAGIRQTTDTFCQAGAIHTLVDRHFAIGPAGEGAVPANYYDPAGSLTCSAAADSPHDATLSVEVDPLLQTTAANMGHFLAEIYECAADGSGLAEIFPGEITQTECQWMLNLLEGTNFKQLAELGIPEDVTFAHKVGYGGQAAGDAGIVFSPSGDYALVIYVWDPRLANLDAFALSRWGLFGEISRIVYNYFNMDDPLVTQQFPPNAFGGAACVLPSDPATINLNDVNSSRFESDGSPLASTCYDWPTCREFNGWDR